MEIEYSSSQNLLKPLKQSFIFTDFLLLKRLSLSECCIVTNSGKNSPYRSYKEAAGLKLP